MVLTMLLLCVFVMVNVFCLAEPACPAGWAQRSGRCYYIFDDKLQRSEAASLCGAHSADLVTYADENEWLYISNLIKTTHFQDGAWTNLKFDGHKWAWLGDKDAKYTELHHWKDVSGSSQPSPTFVPVPDSTHVQAKITFDGTDVFMVVEDASTLLHPFCVREIDSRDLCDTNEKWITILHGCYKLYPAANWGDAVKTCADLRGELIVPESASELKPIISLTAPKTSVWIGAYQANSAYFDVNGQKATYLPWLQGDAGNSQENCVAAKHINSTAKYVHMSCYEELPFFCRRPVGTCPLGWYQDGLNCFKLHIRPEERLTWHMAVDFCKNNDANLVERLNTDKAKLLLNQALQENDVQLAWVGFSGTPHKYYYSTSHMHMAPEPVAFGTTSEGLRCGVSYFSAKSDVTFADYCFTPRPFVCTVQITGLVSVPETHVTHCDPGWIPFNNNCHNINTTAVTYDNAVTSCQAQGASLYIVPGIMHQSFFSTQQFMNQGLENYWIGLKYDSASGNYLQQESNAKAQFLNFDPFQLKDATSGPCIYVGAGSTATYAGSWFHEDCSQRHGFVCHKSGGQTTSKPSLETGWTQECGVGWRFSNVTNQCYFVSPYVRKPWQEARIDCQSLQGELLSISGQDEQNYLENQLTGDLFNMLEEPLWIGVKDLWAGQGWGWSDGQPLKYLHWGEGQPGYDSDDGDNCGYLPVTKKFEWEARPCGDKLGFICKKEVFQPPSTEKSTDKPLVDCEAQPLISGEFSLQFPQDFFASSYKDENHRPENCRMLPSNNFSWSPATDKFGEWLGIRFHSPVGITNIQLRGEAITDHYVSKFKVQYQYDRVSPWYWVRDSQGDVKIFSGVTAPNAGSSYFVIGEIQAQAVKIWPTEWNYGIAMQVEMMGCPQDDCDAENALSGPLLVHDEQITASSEAQNFEARNARLRPVKSGQQLSAWKPIMNDQNPWIQVDLVRKKLVKGVTIQGGQDGSHIDSFQLMFSQEAAKSSHDFITYSEPFGVARAFEVTSAKQSTVYLKSSIIARVVRFNITTLSGVASFKFDVLVCSTGCHAEPQISGFPSFRLAASSSKSFHSAGLSPLKSTGTGGFWQPQFPTQMDASYLQVDMGTVKQVTAVATQGSKLEDKWVKSYYLAFSNNGTTFRRYGENTTYYIGGTAHTSFIDSVVFASNFDGETVVKIELTPPVNARYVQLWPHEFHNTIALRWEVYACSKHAALSPIGCYADDSSDPDLPYKPYKDKYASMWPEVCLSQCYDKGYRYAGLQNGDSCSCGNNYGLYGTGQNCSIHCQAPYNNFTCGGPSNNAVYSTGIGSTSMVCPALWASYKDFCYALLDEDTWLDAKGSCQSLGGHLVDIADMGENAVVANLLEEEAQTAWIGLNDIKMPLNFEWSSGAKVQFTNWGLHQPRVNPGLEQHSVIISRDGSWSNTFSESINSYVCEKPKIPSGDPVTQVQDKGCPRGWKAGGFKCYQFNRQKKSWKDARGLCQLEKATLAHIESSKDNIFLSSILTQLDGRYWTDVHDETLSGFYVHDGASPELLYANWAKQKPDSQSGCVSLGTVQLAGEWTNENCANRNRFVCEQPRTGVPGPSTPTGRPQSACPTGWEASGSRYCYQVNINSTSHPSLSWHEAHANCKQQGAELASFHNDADLTNLLAKFKNNNPGNFWIGLNNLDSLSGFTWSDGSVMNYIPWGDGQPSVYQPLDLCGEVYTDAETMGLQRCYAKRNWICGIEQGKKVMEIEPLVIPTPDPVGACSPLSNGWQRYKAYCYFISFGIGGTNDSLTWREARQFCGTNGADLASIENEEENLFLQGMLLAQDGSSVAWIGLNELDRSHGYQWSDGTPAGKSVLNWNVNEPNDYGGFEACVEILARNGKWNDAHCGVRQGYICKRVAPGITVPTQPPLTRPDGNCPPSFSRFDHKCYRVMGFSAVQDRLSWADARRSCRNLFKADYSVDLASITSPLESAFVTTLLNRANRVSAWIGLRRTATYGTGQFAWADNEDLTYENWNKEEPNMARENDACVYIYGPAVFAGKWNDVSCEEKAAYICQGFVDPSMPKLVVPPSPECDVLKGFQPFGQFCLKVVNQSASWLQAKATCINIGAHLASLHDSYEWAEMFLLSNSFDKGLWIGLNDRTTQGSYKWENGYPVTYTLWAHHQPLDIPGWGCIYMDYNGMFNHGLCSDLRSYVCRKDAQPPQIAPAVIGGRCPDREFFQKNSVCYLMITDARITYERAGQECIKRGATLASIHDTSMASFIPLSQRLWIGLRESINSGFSWEDGSPVDFTKWSFTQPGWSGRGEADEGCVVMSSSGRWYNKNCQSKFGYLCATLPVQITRLPTLPAINITEKAPTRSTEPTPTPYSQESPPSPPTVTTTPGGNTPDKTDKPPVTTQGQKTASTSSLTKHVTKVSGISVATQGQKTASSSGLTKHVTQVSGVSVTTQGQKTPSTPGLTAHITQVSGVSVTTQTTRLSSVRAEKSKSNSEGLGAGETAAVVIGVLALVAVVIIVFILYRRGSLNRSFLRREASRLKNFENSLYMETRKDTLTKGDTREGINITSLTSGARDYSVSYSAGCDTEDDVNQWSLEMSTGTNSQV